MGDQTCLGSGYCGDPTWLVFQVLWGPTMASVPGAVGAYHGCGVDRNLNFNMCFWTTLRCRKADRNPNFEMCSRRFRVLWRPNLASVSDIVGAHRGFCSGCCGGLPLFHGGPKPKLRDVLLDDSAVPKGGPKPKLRDVLLEGSAVPNGGLWTVGCGL